MRLIAMLVIICSLFVPTAFAEQSKPKNQDNDTKKTEEWQPSMALHLLVRCDTMDNVSKALSETWGETPFAIGNGMVVLSVNGQPVPATLVLTVNAETATYTVNAVLPNRNACLLLSGNGFAPAPGQSKKINIDLKPKYIVQK